MNLVIKPVKARARRSKKAIKSTIKFTVVSFIMPNLNIIQNAHVCEPLISKVKHDDYTAVFVADKAETGHKTATSRRNFDVEAKIKIEHTS